MKYFKLILFIPHIIVFTLLNNDKKHLIVMDVNRIMKKKKWNYSINQGLARYLTEDKYYRNIFYLRIGRMGRFMSWLAPGSDYFFPNANIGGGIYLAHPYATILNANKIGENFSCRQCTTIGNKIDGRNDLRPTIGNNVQVGANVVIIGDILIGDNVIIGAGSVVTKDIESNQIVAGNPARLIRKNYL